MMVSFSFGITYVLPILLVAVNLGVPLDKYPYTRKGRFPLNGGRRRLLNIDSRTEHSNQTDLEDSYNATDGNTADQDVCKKSNVMRDNCMTRRICRCDHLCYMYGDCCVDHNLRSLGSATVFQTNITFQQLQNNFQCVELPSRPGYIHRVKLVVKCPDLFEDKQQRQLCENISNTNLIQTVPIFDKILDLSYRNIFCAECNSANNTTPWGVYTDNVAKGLVDERKGLSEIGKAILHNANLVFQLKDTHHRTHDCYNIINTCPHHISPSSNPSIKCDQYLNLIRGVDSNERSIYFKNGHCAACNRFEGLLECSNRSDLERRKHSLETVVNVDEFLASRKGSKEHKCKENEMFDEMKGMCRNVVCSGGHAPSHGKCVAPLLTDTEAEFVSRLQFRTIPALTEEQCSNVKEAWSKLPAKCNYEIVILNEVDDVGIDTTGWTYYETYFACLESFADEITLPATQNQYDRVFIRNFMSKLNGSIDIQFTPNGLRLEAKVRKELIRPSQPVSRKVGQRLSSNCPFLELTSNEATEFASDYLKAVMVGKESVYLDADGFEKNFNIAGSDTETVKNEIFRFHKNSYFICFDAYSRINNFIRKYSMLNKTIRNLNSGPLVYSVIVITLIYT